MPLAAFAESPFAFGVTAPLERGAVGAFFVGALGAAVVVLDAPACVTSFMVSNLTQRSRRLTEWKTAGEMRGLIVCCRLKFRKYLLHIQLVSMVLDCDTDAWH